MIQIEPEHWQVTFVGKMTQLAEPIAPFQLDQKRFPKPARRLSRSAVQGLEWLLSFPDLNRLHARICRLDNARPFAERALEALNVRLTLAEQEFARIPEKGPLVVVANHPFGATDGLALIALMQRRRPDVKILANDLLRRIPELKDVCIFVDPFGTSASVRKNLSGMREALRWVRDGGALVIFPSGEVSSFAFQNMDVADIPWSATAAAMIRKAKAPVLPVYFHGRNSTLFQAAGLVSAKLRLLLLPRELLNKRGGKMEVRIGNLIPPKRLNAFANDTDLANYLRVRTYVLGGRGTVEAGSDDRQQQFHTPVDPPEPSEHFAWEVAQLPPEQVLSDSGKLCVCWAKYHQIPRIMREIGRLRELTFRAVGEGTGQSTDLDRFDESYLHLFVWDQSARQIVGAYRMGLIDQLVSAGGPEALYTSTLFSYDEKLLEQLGPAIELGRSFVRSEYQKEFAPLMMLWKGIGHFVAQHPQYKRLFGPVSISNRYQSLSRQLLIEFLRHNATDINLQKLVAPRNPPRFGPTRNWAARLAGTVVQTIEGVDELVAEIESERMGMPVLLRQYLKLNAKLLGFNVDPDFGDVLDGLMLVDLTQIERAFLLRYLGREGSARFLAYHGKNL